MLIPSFESLSLGHLGGIVPFTGDDDPLGVSKFYSGVYSSPGVVSQGIVIRYNPNTHTASVLIATMQDVWACVFADEPLSSAFGYSASYPAREGELVLVHQLEPGMPFGVIVGRIPYPWSFVYGDSFDDSEFYHRRLFTQKPDTWDMRIPGMTKPLETENDPSTHIATNYRPTDVYPGEFAHVNQHNCGIKGGLFSATLLGGGVSLRLSALSNAARLTCGSYQRHSLSGSTHEFHNGRYLSAERNLSIYQEERLGWYKKDSGNFESNVWTRDSEAPKGGEAQTARPRIKELSGYFGHLVSKFCLRPDPDDKAIRVQGGGSPKEAGVYRETVDPSGQYRLSASGMLAIERTGRIPVPVRKAYPTDKGHDLSRDPATLAPFRHDETDPACRQLELFDRQAYDLKNQYARVDGLDDKANADYDAPQESDLKPLKDEYDSEYTKSRTVGLNKYDKRRAGVYIGEDGSVIVRDAWGSEIVMLGGNVAISCAGNVMTLPGQTALTIAGDDIVQKAQNSVDIHASEHDVRLSAARNMEILGGGDEDKYSGGVLIESRGKGVAPGEGFDQGEGARLSGITLRTKTQGVVLDGRMLNLRSRKATSIVSGDEEIDGQIAIAAKKLRSRAGSTTISSSEGDSHLIVDKNKVRASAGSIGLFSVSNLTLTKGSKTPVPMKWEDIGNNVASELNPTTDETTEDLAHEDSAATPFGKKYLDKARFGFRTSRDCRTDRPWVMGAKGKFRMYEPAWVQVMDVFETLKSEKVDAVPYKEKAEWENKDLECGLPFPGKMDEDSGFYVRLKDLKPPRNLTSDGFNASRGDVRDKTELDDDVKLSDGYLVRSDPDDPGGDN